MNNFLHMTLNVVFAILMVFFIGSILILAFKGLILVVQFILKKKDQMNVKGLLKTLVKVGTFFMLIVFVIGVSQWSAFTPKIKSENSISELKEVEFNGRKQWISIRGEDKDAPILLFLAGGPGGSQLAAVRYEMPELEKEFVVVGWDQPGSAKSYGARKDLKPSDYIEDGIALTDYLCERFEEEKIYIVGESWGSYLGIMMADEEPQKYYGIINTGQMVDFLETELIDYTKALALSTTNGEIEKMTRLIKIGKPPYYSVDVTWRSAEYLNYLTEIMNENPEINNPGYETIRDILSSEYGILDKLNYVLGILNTFNDVYQQLYDVDIRVTQTELEVPIKFLIGRHDLSAPTSLAAEYYNILDAPLKEFVWFEHSGHNPWINESESFINEILKFKEQISAKVSN